MKQVITRNVPRLKWTLGRIRSECRYRNNEPAVAAVLRRSQPSLRQVHFSEPRQSINTSSSEISQAQSHQLDVTDDIDQAKGLSNGMNGEDEEAARESTTKTYSKIPTPSSAKELHEQILRHLDSLPGFNLTGILKIGERVSLSFAQSKPASKLVASVKFSNAGSANSLDTKTLEELTLSFKALAMLENLAGVLFGSKLSPGSAFSSGANTSELLALRNEDDAEQFIQRISALCSSIRDLPAPAIALIHGPCIGAALEVAASCDIRWATTSPHTCFQMPEVRLGIPSVVEARRLCELIGWGRARHLMLLGSPMYSRNAYEAGLVTWLFDDPKAMYSNAYKFLMRSAAHGWATAAQKALMRKWELSTLDEGIEAGVEAFAKHFNSANRSNTLESMESNLALAKAAARKKQAANKTQDDKEA